MKAMIKDVNSTLHYRPRTQLHFVWMAVGWLMYRGLSSTACEVVKVVNWHLMCAYILMRFIRQYSFIYYIYRELMCEMGINRQKQAVG